MITHRGILLVAGSVVAIVVGRILGLTELFILGAAAAILLAAAVVYVRTARFALKPSRRIHGDRVHVGEPSRAELSVTNLGRHTSAPFELVDAVSGRRPRHLLVPPLEPGERARAVQMLPTDRRGVYSIGPMRALVRDPFGLASTSKELLGPGHLTVFPRVEPVDPLPASLGGNDPALRGDQPSYMGQHSEDLSTLRHYEEGDDLRRVHWRSTARLGQLMVRQDEMPWDSRTTLVVDVRRSLHSAASLETAISAAASIATAASTDPCVFRTVATNGADSGFGAGRSHNLQVLEQLARLQWTSSASLVTTLNKVCRGTAGGTLVLVTTTSVADLDLRRIAALRSRFPRLTLVMVERRSPRPGSSDRAGRAGVAAIRVPEQGSLAAALGRPERLGPWSTGPVLKRSLT